MLPFRSKSELKCRVTFCTKKIQFGMLRVFGSKSSDASTLLAVENLKSLLRCHVGDHSLQYWHDSLDCKVMELEGTLDIALILDRKSR